MAGERARLRAQGFRFIGGTKDSAVSPDGTIYPRRQWQKLGGAPLPKTPARKMARYNAMVTAFQHKRGESGDLLTRRDVRSDTDFRDLVRELRTIHEAEKRASRNGRPWIVFGRPPEYEQRLRAVLVALGRRDPEWDFAVGESPS